MGQSVDPAGDGRSRQRAPGPLPARQPGSVRRGTLGLSVAQGSERQGQPSGPAHRPRRSGRTRGPPGPRRAQAAVQLIAAVLIKAEALDDALRRSRSGRRFAASGAARPRPRPPDRRDRAAPPWRARSRACEASSSSRCREARPALRRSCCRRRAAPVARHAAACRHQPRRRAVPARIAARALRQARQCRAAARRERGHSVLAGLDASALDIPAWLLAALARGLRR